MNSRYTISIPSLNDFVYTIMLNASMEQKKALSYSEQLCFKSLRAMKTFSCKSSMEKKMVLLTKLGIEFVFFASPGAVELDDAIFMTYEQYLTQERQLNTIEAQARNRVYAVGSKQMMTAANICAQNAQTKIYALTGTTKRMLLNRHDQADLAPGAFRKEGAEEALHYFNKFILDAHNSLLAAPKERSLTGVQIRVLQSLYERENAAMKGDDILLKVHEPNHPQKVFTALNDLIHLGHVNCDRKRDVLKTAPGQKTWYMITASGKNIIIQYIQSLIEKQY